MVLGRVMAWEEAGETLRSGIGIWPKAPNDEQLLRYAVWVARGVIWPLAAESTPVPEQLLDRFFMGYWPASLKELHLALGGDSDMRSLFDGDVEELLSNLRQAVVGEDPATIMPRLGSALQKHFLNAGADEESLFPLTIGLEYGGRLLAAKQAFAKLDTL